MTVGENKPKVIVIPAAPKNTGTAEQRQLRVAAYCRVSTKEEEQLNSYEAQKNNYPEKIMENKSWTMADIFADEGITGTSAKKRADFMRMMKWCKQGKIKCLTAGNKVLVDLESLMSYINLEYGVGYETYQNTM